MRRCLLRQYRHKVHLQKVEVGFDYSDRVEILNVLHEGDTIVSNPGDVIEDALKMDAVPAPAGK
jgi:hypothetical protein